jgi:hypothetical protein
VKRVPISWGMTRPATVWVQAREIAAYLRELEPAELADELDRLAERIEQEEADRAR